MLEDLVPWVDTFGAINKMVLSETLALSPPSNMQRAATINTTQYNTSNILECLWEKMHGVVIMPAGLLYGTFHGLLEIRFSNVPMSHIHACQTMHLSPVLFLRSPLLIPLNLTIALQVNCGLEVPMGNLFGEVE